jgi:CDP-glucose 4,6-dehydratase
MLFESFSGKKILITGHTGFKGSWLAMWLKTLNAEVAGIALEPATSPSHFEAAGIFRGIIDLRVNIKNRNALIEAVQDIQPDFVFHLAAQALVTKSYNDPIDTYETNVMGTLHLLEALRQLDKSCSAVIITSDKCYDNVEWVWGYKETDAIGGPDPYSASKGAAELVIRSHIKSYFPLNSSKVRIASARAGNVIGGGDWSDSRIVPDCIKAWSENREVKLRNPNSTRPWQHVLEPLSGYLCLALCLSKKSELHGEPFNFGPQAQQNHSVLELVQHMAKSWDQVRWIDHSDSDSGPYESGLLKLNCPKFSNIQKSLKTKASLGRNESGKY